MSENENEKKYGDPGWDILSLCVVRNEVKGGKIAQFRIWSQSLKLMGENLGVIVCACNSSARK